QQDSIENVVIKIPASPGYEKAPTVIIQGHMDMVCEKTTDSTHDFSKDPINVVRKGDWLMAEKTTLGADNGIAIAMGQVMALDKSLKHPPLELLFTVDEETGLSGAFALEPDFIEGRLLLNLDSEEEGVFTIGCSGGQKSNHTLPLDFEAIPEGFVPVTIAAGGMSGGHSADIHEEKANAIKVLGRTLNALQDKMDLRLAHISGGSADNAIPRNAEAVIFIATENIDTIGHLIKQIQHTFNMEFNNTDPELELIIKEGPDKSIADCLSISETRRVVDFILALPHGIWAMSTEVEHFVETSNNLANIQMEPLENGKRGLKVITSQRSPLESRLDAVTLQIEALVRLIGGSTKNRGRYPGWQANTKSHLLEKCVSVYRELFKKEPIVETTHGGLECGVIGSKVPGMDMISFGPTIKYPHSPEEKIHIGSIGEVWDFFAVLLESIK
ncbi:MAG: aminoacyl-histidine dipeptidase, partial [bacterium]|nr:aminoacyl-histidine dipeptidase [bacterium]